MSELITVRKANRVIDVSKNELEKYLANGYVIREPKQPEKKVEAPKPVVEKKVVEEPKVVEDTIVTKQPKAQQTTGRKRRSSK